MPQDGFPIEETDLRQDLNLHGEQRPTCRNSNLVWNIEMLTDSSMNLQVVYFP